MGILFLLALLGGSPLLALIIFGSMWLDASAKDDRDRERRQFNIEESRHRDLMRRSYEAEHSVCSAVGDAAQKLSESTKERSGRKRRTRSVIRYTDGTVEGREIIDIRK